MKERLPLHAESYVMVINEWGTEIPICDACFRKGCYKKKVAESGHERDCKRIFKMILKNGKETIGQCCCYGHPEGDYMEDE